MITLPLGLLLCAASGQGPDTIDQDTISLAELRAEIRAAERSFGGIRVESQCTWSVRESTAASFTHRGGLEATLWFSARPGGRARCEFHREISPWINGPAEFCEESYVATYDGRIGRVFRTSTGPMGETFAIQRANVVPERPSYIELGARASGWMFSTPGFFDQDIRRFSDMLASDADHLTVAGPGGDAAGLVRVVRSLMLNDVELRDTWVLDPGRRFALVEYESKVGANVLQHLVVEELRESNGLYWPARSTRVVRMPDASEVREEMRTAATTLSFDEFEAVSFDIALPPGTTFEDPVSDVVLTIGYPEEELVPELEAAAALLAGSLENSAPLQEGLLATPAPAADTAFDTATLRNVLLGLGLLLVGYGAARVLQRSGRGVAVGKAGLATVLMASLLLTSANAQQVSLAADELGSHRVFNCGVNVASVVLRTFGKDSDLRGLALALDCGDHWERPTSLSQLAAVFESHELAVEALRGVPTEQVLARLGHGNVAVLHVADRNGRQGHFLVLGGVRGDEVFVVDATRSCRWTRIPEFVESHAELLSGYGLMIAAESAAAPKEMPTLSPEAEVCELDLGDVSDVAGMVSTSVRVRNDGSSPLRLKTTASSCSCFQGALFDSGRKQIPVGGEDVLHLQFDRAKLAAGTNEQQVLVLFEHEDHNRRVLFRVRAVVRATEVSRKVAVLPQQIDWGIVRDQGDLRAPQRVSLQLPNGVAVLQVNPSSEHVIVRRVRTTSDHGAAYRMPSRTETFEVELEPAAAESVREEVVFVLSDPQLKTVRVPILAELAYR